MSDTRPIPQDSDAEMALLGSCCIGGLDTIGEVLDVLPAEATGAFMEPARQVLWYTLADMHAAKERVDLVSVKRRLERVGELERVGGVEWLERVGESQPSHLNALAYARMVAEKHNLRQLIQIGRDLDAAAHAHDADPIELARSAADRISRVESGSYVESAIEDAGDTLTRIIADIESREDADAIYWATGFDNLDAIIIGVSPGDLIVIAARPSMGKSALAMNVAFRMARQGFPVAFVSFEMSRERIMHRLVAMVAEIPLDAVKRATKHDADLLKTIRIYQSEIKRRPLFIIDTRGRSQSNVRTLNYVMALIRRVVRKHGCRVVFVDYLQLMDVPGMGREPRHFRVQVMTSSLKALAEELGIAIFILCQINREATYGGSFDRPTMSQLRESGSIEQDADQVWLIHRPAFYDQAGIWNANPLVKGYAELIVDKNRDGQQGRAAMKWQGPFQRFDDMNERDAEYCREATKPQRRGAKTFSDCVEQTYEQLPTAQSATPF